MLLGCLCLSLTGCPQPPWTLLVGGLFPFGSNGLIVYLDPSDTRADYLTNGNGNEQGVWALKADLPFADVPLACQGTFFQQHVPNGCVLPECSDFNGAIGWPTIIVNSAGQRIEVLDLVSVQFQVGHFSSVAGAISMYTNVPNLTCNYDSTLTPGEALNGETEWVPEHISCLAYFSDIENVANPGAYQTNEMFTPGAPGGIEAGLELSIPNPYALEWTGTWTFTYPNGCVMAYMVDMKPWAVMTEPL